MPEPRAISDADRAWLAERGYQVPRNVKIKRCERGESGLLVEHGKFREGAWKVNFYGKRGRRPKHDDEIRQMVENAWSVPMIAKALGMGDPGVRRACERLGLKPRALRRGRQA